MTDHRTAIAVLELMHDDRYRQWAKLSRKVIDHKEKYPDETVEAEEIELAEIKADLDAVAESIKTLQSQMLVIEFNVEVRRFDRGRVVIDDHDFAAWFAESPLTANDPNDWTAQDLQLYLADRKIEPKITRGEDNEVHTWTDGEDVTP